MATEKTKLTLSRMIFTAIYILIFPALILFILGNWLWIEGWSASFPLWLKIIGGIGLLKSAFFFYRSYSDNTFLSSLVRIQSERKQQVVSSGVYGFVRHPMYLGGILMFIGTPLLLGSFFGILIAVMVTFLLVGRIIGEERMLVKGLEGYPDYQNKVKYRLIPFIW